MFKLAKLAVAKPVSTLVGVLLIVLFGVVSLINLPIQMKPNLDKPIITVTTSYPGAAPLEVEEQITDKFEEKLNAIEGLRKLSSTSSDARSDIEMEFEWGVDRDARFVDVLEKLNQVGEYPEEAERPVIAAVSSVEEERIMWIMMQSETLSVEEMTYFATEDIKDTLERVDGVGNVQVFGGREREITVFLDPQTLVSKKITVPQVRQAILSENRNVRGGYIDEGKVRFNVRTTGQFTDIEALNHLVIARTDAGIIELGDLGRVVDNYERPLSIVRGNVAPMLALGVARKIGANVVEVTENILVEIEKLNQRFATFSYKGRKAGLRLEPAYREADYIWKSINFVTQNLIVGALLAATVLLFFLRSLRSTLIVAIVIPICFISIFIFLQALGRSVNIISLAGIAFAVGMTVDNAIVVIENIYRHLEMGKPRRQATLDGVGEVWGAILASTLTTMAVFLPVLYVKEEAGELFKDIAITISCSVAMSLLVSFSVIPMLASRLLKEPDKRRPRRLLTTLSRIVTWPGMLVYSFFILVANVVTGKYWQNIGSGAVKFSLSMVVKLLIIAVIAIASIAIVRAYVPPMEYLPTGNRNMVLVVYKTHTGTNIYKASDISLQMEEKIYGMLFDPNKPDTPENRVVERMFAVASTRFSIIGVITKEKYAYLPVKQLPLKINPRTHKPFRSAMDYLTYRVGGYTFGTPGTQYAFAVRRPLFGRFRGKSFEVEVRGPDIKRLESIAGDLEKQLGDLGQQVGFTRITSEFELGLPEIRVAINRDRAGDLGIKTAEIAEVVETLVAGRKTSVFKDGAQEVDILVRAVDGFLDNIENLRKLQFIAGTGLVVLESVADVYVTTGPTKVFHRERNRAIPLTVYLPEEKPLEEAVAQARELVINPLLQKLPGEYYIEIAGSASDLDRTVQAFIWSFLLAVLVTYLLLSSLFESFLYPFVIMLTVPLAISGSILAIHINDVPLDMLAVLGEIILCGIVVNNAILVVHQTLNFQNSGMDATQAIRESVRSRLRPVFMSSITTVFGILPMCLKGAPGSELYSGLGTAIVGGLLFSTIFTLILVPTILALIIDIKNLLRRRLLPLFGLLGN